MYTEKIKAVLEKVAQLYHPDEENALRQAMGRTRVYTDRQALPLIEAQSNFERNQRVLLQRELDALSEARDIASENRKLNNAREISRASELGKLEAAKQFRGSALLGRLGQGIALAAGLVVGATFVDKIVDYLGDTYDKFRMKDYFEKMLEAHPQLQNEDPALVAKYWESLNHFSPHMAKDPLAAGAFITQSIRRMSGDQFGGPPPDTYNSLSTIQKNYAQANDIKKYDMNTLTKSEATKNFVNDVWTM